MHVGKPLVTGVQVGRFKIMRLVGSGGMGEVYLARDIQLGRKVALKMIRANQLTKQARERFLFEAQVTAQFSHPNIITIYDVGEYEERPYVALAYLEGETLRDRLCHEQIPRSEALRIAQQVAKALKEAHQYDLLHRDLKPENIFLCKDGRVQVLDFGLAKIIPPPTQQQLHSIDFDGVDIGNSQGQSLQIMGTPEYMAPEQWRLQSLTPATDIWAFGIILHELILGYRPYPQLADTQESIQSETAFADTVAPTVGATMEAEADTTDAKKAFVEELYKQVTDPELTVLLPNTSGPDALRTLVCQCLEKEHPKRPTSESIVLSLGKLLSQHRDQKEPTRPHNPFRGLRAFTEQHADFFFGRDTEVSALLEAIREVTTLPIVGPSGVGKSSLVRAGLIPRLLAQGNWKVLRFRPGHRPFRALASSLLAESKIVTQEAISSLASQRSSVTPSVELADALADQWQDTPSSLSAWLYQYAEEIGQQVLLFVDQFEEIYTLVDDPQEREGFLQAICTAADDPQDPIRAVFTLRNDFLGRLTGSPEVRKALNQASILWAPDTQALEEIVTAPLQRLGYQFDDPTLLPEMLSAIQHEPSALPLLQFAIHQLWERRDKEAKRLTRKAHDDMGGVVGALAHHADTMLEGLSSQQIEQVRELMLRLVTSEGTRRVISRRELLHGLDDTAREQLDRLVDARLLVARKSRSVGDDDAVIELAHEALISTWVRLSRWMYENHEERSFLAELNAAAALWVKRGRQDEEVWRGNALREATKTRSRLTLTLPPHAAEFVERGELLQARRESIQRRNRTIRWAVVAAFSLIASLLAIAFYGQKEEATQQARAATRHLARSLREGAQSALAQHNVIVAKAKLRRSLELHPTTRARLLWHKLRHTSLQWNRIIGGGMLAQIQFSSNGSQLSLIRGSAKGPYILDITKQTLRPIKGLPQVTPTSFSIDPNRRSLLLGACGGKWLLQHQKEQKLQWLPQFPKHTCVALVAYHPNGPFVAGVTGKGHLTAFNRRTGTHWSTNTKFTNRTQRSLVFAPTQRPLLAFHSWRKIIKIWSPQTNKLWTLRTNNSVRHIAFSPDGSELITGHNNGKIHFWNVRTQQKRQTLQFSSAGLQAIRLIKGGSQLLTVDKQGIAILWSLREKRVIWLRKMKAKRPYFAAIAPGGRFVAVGDWGYFRGTLATNVRLWDLHAKTPNTTKSGHYSSIWNIRFHPQKPIVITNGNDQMARCWHLNSGKVTMRFWLRSTLNMGLAISKDGRYAASSGKKSPILLWDLHTNTLRHRWLGHKRTIKTIAFSPSGTSLYSANFGKKFGVFRWQFRGKDGRLKLQRVYSERLRFPQGGFGWNPLFSPQAKTLAVWTRRTSWHWDLQNGTVMRLPNETKSYAWSRDERLMATATKGKDRRFTVNITDRESGKTTKIDTLNGWVKRMAFGARGHKLLISRNHRLFVWDLRKKKRSWIKGALENGRLQFSPDGRYLATSAYSGLYLWHTKDWSPKWWAPFFDKTQKQLLTHRGWEAIGHTKPIPQSAWRARLQQRVFAAKHHTASHTLCIQTHDDRLLLWDTQKDRSLYQRYIGPFEQLLATPAGCVIRKGTLLHLHHKDGSQRQLHRDANVVAWDKGQLLIESKRYIHILQLNGTITAAYKIQTPRRKVSCLRSGRGWIAVGFQHGNIEIVPTKTGTHTPTLSFERTPSGAVSQLALGPSNTLIAGFWDGQVYAWDLRTGRMIFDDQLHGAVSHLHLHKTTLYAATVLGDANKYELETLTKGRCGLLRDIWKRVPWTWYKGRLYGKSIPTRHPCQSLRYK